MTRVRGLIAALTLAAIVGCSTSPPSPTAPGPPEPYKLGMFRQDTRMFLGLVVGDDLVVDLSRANVGAPATPRLWTQAPASAVDRPAFELASVKANRSKSGDDPGILRLASGGRFTATNIPLHLAIQAAYQLKPHQMIARSEWDRLLSDRFDIEAKAEGNAATYAQIYLMLQSLLADRFKLMVHRETRQLPVYVLVLSKPGTTGPRLRPHSDDAECIDGSVPLGAPDITTTPFCGDFRTVVVASGALREIGNRITMDRLAWFLSQEVDRPVVDRTGLSGVFDQDFEFVPHDVPLIRAAVQEQLGLILEPQTGPVDVLVIDHVEQPSEN